MDRFFRLIGLLILLTSRPARADDFSNQTLAPTLVTIQQSAYLLKNGARDHEWMVRELCEAAPLLRGPESWVLKDFAEQILNGRMRNMFYFVAISISGDYLGYANFSFLNNGRLLLSALHRSQRVEGWGVGSLLMDAVMTTAQRFGVPVEICDSTWDSAPFYHRYLMERADYVSLGVESFTIFSETFMRLSVREKAVQREFVSQIISRRDSEFVAVAPHLRKWYTFRVAMHQIPPKHRVRGALRASA
jgi:hypothetical protein